MTTPALIGDIGGTNARFALVTPGSVEPQSIETLPCARYAGLVEAIQAYLERPILFGLVSGLGVSTAGLWLESLWIDAVYHYPWPMGMWPEALAMAVPVAVLVGACGAMVGMVFTGQRLPRRGIGIAVVVATLLVIGGAVANGLQYQVPPRTVLATIKLKPAPPVDGHQMVSADVRFSPHDAISDDPEWVSILAWQGRLPNHRGIVVDNLSQDEFGLYHSTQPIPVWGEWKTLLRVQDGKTMAGIPIHLPADPAIGITTNEGAFFDADESLQDDTPYARPYEFMQEIKILQRERSFDAPGWLWAAACLVVLACTLLLIAALTWGTGRINNSETETPAEAEDRPTVRA